MSGAVERIFLYGTLRCGGSRDVQRFYEGVEFVGPARVRGVLYDMIEYPGFRLAADAGWVRGEVFDVTPAALAGLDAWEGIDPASSGTGEYRRVRVGIEHLDGSIEECWAYEVSEAHCAGRDVIVSGDWIAHHAARV